MADFDFTKPVYKTPRKDKTFVDLTGQTFTRLTVLGYVGRDGQRCSLWHCKCICGEERLVRGTSLRKGITLSCGCLQAEIAAQTFTKHGHSRDKEYKIYHAARDRCQNPRNKRFADYGGRGIEFHFTSVEDFISTLGPRPSAQHSVDRIDNDGHYEVGNVRWATPKEQIANSRTMKR